MKREQFGICIICGNKFNRYVQTSNGLTMYRPQKATCSEPCRLAAEKQRQKIYQRERKEWRAAQKKAAKRRMQEMVRVEVKCPYCEKIHYELMDEAPLVMPRVYCNLHRWCRERSLYGRPVAIHA